MSTTTPAYEQLTALYTRLHRLDHLGSIAGWDQAANMPPKGNEARAAALAELATLTHRLRTDPALRCTLEQAEQENLSEDQRANLREIRRDWRAANALPESLVERRHGRPHAASTRGAPSAQPTTGRAFSKTSARSWPWAVKRRRAWPTSSAAGGMKP